jgi:hypothetical protein
MLNKEYFVFQYGDNYYITQFEESLPPNKLAARIRLTDAALKGLTNLHWREYQSLLEHYYEHGQKLVTA